MSHLSLAKEPVMTAVNRLWVAVCTATIPESHLRAIQGATGAVIRPRNAIGTTTATTRLLTENRGMIGVVLNSRSTARVAATSRKRLLAHRSARHITAAVLRFTGNAAVGHEADTHGTATRQLRVAVRTNGSRHGLGLAQRPRQVSQAFHDGTTFWGLHRSPNEESPQHRSHRCEPTCRTSRISPLHLSSHRTLPSPATLQETEQTPLVAT